MTIAQANSCASPGSTGDLSPSVRQQTDIAMRLARYFDDTFLAHVDLARQNECRGSGTAPATINNPMCLTVPTAMGDAPTLTAGTASIDFHVHCSRFFRHLTNMDDKTMKNISKHQWYRTMSGIGIAAVAIAGCASLPPPTEQIAVSKMAVSTAVSAGGNEYASADMRAAQDKLDRAIQAMTAEDYKNARLLAEQAEVDAQLAASKARSAKAQKAAVAVQEDSRVLRKEIDRKSQ